MQRQPAQHAYSSYLDELLPALFLRSVTRRGDGEYTVVDPLFLDALLGSLRGTAYALGGGHLVAPYVALWSELLVPAHKDTVARLADSNYAGTCDCAQRLPARPRAHLLTSSPSSAHQAPWRYTCTTA
jgi:hypothetical protein